MRSASKPSQKYLSLSPISLVTLTKLPKTTGHPPISPGGMQALKTWAAAILSLQNRVVLVAIVVAARKPAGSLSSPTLTCRIGAMDASAPAVEARPRVVRRIRVIKVFRRKRLP
jgi:hypothetical protein